MMCCSGSPNSPRALIRFSTASPPKIRLRNARPRSYSCRRSMELLRKFHHKALLGALLLLLAGAGWAQSYPSRAVKFVVPFPPGALPDQIARVIGADLQEALGQPFVMENRPGAIGVVGTAE